MPFIVKIGANTSVVVPIPVQMFQVSFVEEVALSAAQRSLVSLLHCIPYDGFSLLFPRRAVCFLFRCIPRGQLVVVLWH